jgi:hypothetical protein
MATVYKVIQGRKEGTEGRNDDVLLPYDLEIMVVWMVSLNLGLTRFLILFHESIDTNKSAFFLFTINFCGLERLHV